MRIEHHIGFRLDVNAEFTAMLIANGVDVDSTKMIQAVTVYEDEPTWKYIAPFVENQTVRSICSMVFSIIKHLARFCLICFGFYIINFNAIMYFYQKSLTFLVCFHHFMC